MTFPSVEWSDSEIADRVLHLMDRTISALTVFSGPQECALRILARCAEGVPPARKNQNHHDCMIFEHVLELIGKLRSAGFDERVLFVTSNRNDYGAAPRGFSRIASDLQSVAAEYVSNIAWAYSQVRSAPG